MPTSGQERTWARLALGPKEGVSGAGRTSLYGLLQLFMLGLQLGKHAPAIQIVLQLLENPKKSP